MASGTALLPTFQYIKVCFRKAAICSSFLRASRMTSRLRSTAVTYGGVVPTTNEDQPDAHCLNVQAEAFAMGKRVYLEAYGCQMNFSDASVVRSVLQKVGYVETEEMTEADAILLMTCAIRQSAEDKIWKRVEQIRSVMNKRARNRRFTLGILGCMANKRNLKSNEDGMLPAGVDLFAGPDAYRDLPRLLAVCSSGQKSANIILSCDETYADIRPVRKDGSAFAYISIMRGCNNMCTYCIVPFTRGRERSRPFTSIEDEFCQLRDEGVKEVTLLGQNVNSYCDTSSTSASSNYSSSDRLSAGFSSICKAPSMGIRFADLLDRLSLLAPNMRIRFTSPHPKDFPDEVLEVMKERANICKCIHLPAQSGSNKVLERMNRGYTVEAYLNLVDRIRSMIPDVTLTSDFISGFCGETEEDHQETLRLIRTVQYVYCYTFMYSMRQRTRAHYRLVDDVPTEVKKRRSKEVHEEFRQAALLLNSRLIGSRQIVLVEKESKRSCDHWMGRTDGNTKVILPKTFMCNHSSCSKSIHVGDYVLVQVTDASSETLKGEPVEIYQNT
ncbi:CDK5 regulatory subunit-associated protein 1 family protein [Trichuris suis]|nr:CDK5 regulatory subunit-associated protein 1 family protein [Trichuris suis]